MKYLCLLLLVAASQAYVARPTRSADNLPTPTLIRLTTYDNPYRVQVDWLPVDSPDISEPILGYKLNVWAQRTIRQVRYETIDGVKTLVEKEVPVELTDAEMLKTKPDTVITVGAHQISATVPIEVGIWYQSRVQAFNRNGDGPLSLPMGIRIVPKEESQKDLYNTVN